LNRAVEESLDHLRPWMPWVAFEPLSIEARRDLIQAWEREETEGAGTVFGIFVDDQVAGGCGLHRRIGPGGFEIGYWVHQRAIRRGIATTAARLLTDAAFGVPSTTHVEIHHDKANTASAAVPRRLGYRFVAERADEVTAPGEVGIDCCWRVERDEWR
jgi:ribosomal-protein-serine acetyltransferase